ncbi:MAG: T9SS type A sorting domain-containing protein [bacterium]|nr:T9SS type A sorting domain-containing protein [bacterium]
MRYLLFLILLLPLTAFSQQFQFHQELDSIPVWDGDYHIPTPWTGGYGYTVPVFCDIDADGDLDPLLGNSGGVIAFYENNGTTSIPFFKLLAQNFQDIQGFAHSVPRFVDIDNDGDYDLFCDFGDEYMHFYRNVGSPTIPQLALEEDSLRDTGGNLIDGSGFTLCDIDDDGDQDLFVQQWYNGHIYYYENIGNPTQFAFSLVSTSFAGVSTGEWCHPTFCDLDSDGDYDLFIGNKYGKIYFYRNDGTPQQYDFTLISNNWFGIDVGDYASPEFCDIDGDGDYDLFIGKDNDLTYDIPGAMQYWENIGTPQVCNFVLRNQNYLTFDAGCCCDPDLCDIDRDGDLDLFFLTNSQLGWMENIGTNQNPEYAIRTFDLLDLPPGSCDLGDLNGDQYPDLVTVNGWGGAITLWVNRVTPQNPTFVEFSSIDTDWILGGISMGDLDADGDLDIIVGGMQSGEYHLLYYQNQGTSYIPNFVQVAQSLPGVSYNALMPSALADIDMDGDLDLLLIENFQEIIYYYENIGSPQSMYFTLNTTSLLNQQTVDASSVDAADIDHDEDMDLFVGYYIGGIQFFRNVTGDSTAVPIPPKQRPRPCRATLTIGPNPSNPITAISYQLSAVSLVNLSVYDISGRRVAQLVNARQNPGDYSVSWNASGNASGVYLVRLETPQEEVTQKVVVIK